MSEKEPKTETTNLFGGDGLISPQKKAPRGAIHNSIMMELQAKIKAHRDSLRQVKDKYLEGESGGRRSIDSPENLSN